MLKRRSSSRLVLETISVSHYVEKVRWVLDYLAVPYTEEVCLSTQHYVLC